MKGRNQFTGAEADKIQILLRRKSTASSTDKKTIRSTLRRIGFHIEDYSTSKDEFLEHDFERLVRSGCITVVDNELGPDNSAEMLTHRSHRTTRDGSDESYILDLCDRVLGKTSIRQHKFDFLRGDTTEGRVGVRLPVDAFYPTLNLVVEYREHQHTEAVPFFDKPNRMTVSGVHRGEQRALYDQRRRDVLPLHGITLIELSYADFRHGNDKRLVRRQEDDLQKLRQILSQWVS